LKKAVKNCGKGGPGVGMPSYRLRSLSAAIKGKSQPVNQPKVEFGGPQDQTVVATIPGKNGGPGMGLHRRDIAANPNIYKTPGFKRLTGW